MAITKSEEVETRKVSKRRRKKSHETSDLPLRRSVRAVKHTAVAIQYDDDSTDKDSLYDDGEAQSSDHKPKKRRLAGVSTAKFPPITESVFGLLQEKLWHEPFWLLIAVTFLNKTAGKSAAPVFWKLKSLYPTPADLAAANEQDLIELIRHLGLQTQRARRLIKMATAWNTEQANKDRQYRTLHYPFKGDGKGLSYFSEGDSVRCTGSLEIGHIPGCGPYAFDSWRIFCRDVLRGTARDYNGLGAAADFEPEWKRVLPLDKELRAYLRWMWLREGYVWNHETGEKRLVTEKERLQSIRGELEPSDDDEARFVSRVNEQVYLDDPATGQSKAEDPLEHGFATAHARRKRRRTTAVESHCRKQEAKLEHSPQETKSRRKHRNLSQREPRKHTR